MTHSASARKRIRQTEDRTARNRWRKRRVKDKVKTFLEAVQAGDASRAAEAYREATKELDKVAAKGAIHSNAAARRKSRLAARLNAMSPAAAASA